MNLLATNVLIDSNLITAIASIITAIVGIATFIILLIQYKYLKKQTELLAKQLNMSSYNESYAIFIESDKLYVEHPDLRKYTGKKEVVEDFEKNILTKENLREIAIITLRLNLMQLNYQRKKLEVRQSDSSSGESKSLHQILENPYVLNYWKSNYRSVYNDDFVKEVDRIIKENEENERNKTEST
jgi:hypothetical protein